MIVTTTNAVEGRRVREYRGIVFGEVITGINMFKDIGAGLRNIFGGRSQGYEEELQRAREEALAALGELLQGDEESICKGISLASHRLAKSLEEARDSRAEREKRAGALWLSGAALLVILLI